MNLFYTRRAIKLEEGVKGKPKAKWIQKKLEEG